MLEHPVLWIGPDPEGAARWLIREAASRRLLGLARPRPGRSWPRWLGWPTLEVCESEDEALLFTLDRYWGWRTTWLVRDADDREVGRLQGRAALDSHGQCLGLLEPDQEGRHWRHPAGQLLATIREADNASVLTFACEENPFLRMLLLAAVLRR